MRREDLKQGFDINTTISGIPVAVKPYNDNANKKGAQLQFATITDKGLQTIDVKVESSREEDLEKFINQHIVIGNINISKVDFNTYYSCPNIGLIGIKKSA